MSEPEQDQKDETKISVGRLTGKTTAYEVQVLITNPDVKRNDYFVIYGAEKEDGERPYYLLNITDMWSDAKGVAANLQVLGERPDRPFDVGAEVYLASEEQITKLLGIYNPPNLSVSLGKLMGYPFKVNLLVKNFGRIFITGKSGSGKSYTMGVLCEEFLKKGIPIVIIDRHGEYGSLKIASDDLEEEEDSQATYCPFCGVEVPDVATECGECGKSLEFEAAPQPEDSELFITEDIDIDEPNASEYVDNIIEFADLKTNEGGDLDIEYLFSLKASDIVAPNLCTIVNLRGMNLEIQETIAGRLLKKLYTASTGRQIPPFYLLLDEAHLFAGKKKTETCEIVKLFAQEGRKFGANIIIGTQRPQLLDTTIRAQAGTWVVHNLSDIRDIQVTIQSAEDLKNDNKNDISGLDKGQAIVCGEAVAGIPLFVQVRRRKTKHGGMGFNPLDFLSEQTKEELQKRRERILGKKSEEELEAGKTEFNALVEPKTPKDYIEEIKNLRQRIKDLEHDVQYWKQKCDDLEEAPVNIGDVPSEDVKELQMQVKTLKAQYEALKQGKISVQTETVSISDSGDVTEYKEEIKRLKEALNLETEERRKAYNHAKESLELLKLNKQELKGYKNKYPPP